jgi:hypothetical protein
MTEELTGAALAKALKDADLSTEGTADEKRARLAEHQNGENTESTGSADLAPPSDEPGAVSFKGNGGDPIVADSGPGTGTAAAASGPLEAPRDEVLQSDPPLGYEESSTDNVFAEAGGLTFPGERYEALVDEDGSKISADDLFTDEDAGKTFVTVEKRIYEVFFYPNTTEKCQRLLYTPGQRVGRADAERLRVAVKAASA